MSSMCQKGLERKKMKRFLRLNRLMKVFIVLMLLDTFIIPFLSGFPRNLFESVWRGGAMGILLGMILYPM